MDRKRPERPPATKGYASYVDVAVAKGQLSKKEGDDAKNDCRRGQKGNVAYTKKLRIGLISRWKR